MAEILAQGVIPIIIFVVILWSAVSGDKVYEHFTSGALKGLKITAELLPTLIGLPKALQEFAVRGRVRQTAGLQ